MKMVSAFVLRLSAHATIVAAVMATTTACTGTPTDESAGTIRDEVVANPVEPTPAATDPDASEIDLAAPTTAQSQDPQERVGAQRRVALVEKSIAEARRALEFRLWSDAAKIASEVLELDPSNEEARQILVDAQSALGIGGVESNFRGLVQQNRVALQKTLLDVRNELSLGDAQMEQGNFGQAVDNYERAKLLLDYSPLQQPSSELEQAVVTKLESARQAVTTARQAEEQARAAASRADLEAEERRLRIQRTTRVKRLVEDANLDFQVGNYERAVRQLDQALIEEPNNSGALELRQLAAQAQHENRLDLLRQDWKQAWSTTFDELNALDVPQTETVVYDMERWREVSKRTPLKFTAEEDLESPEEKAIRQKLDGTRIEHRFTSATVQDWADYYARITDVTFVVSPEVADLDEESTTLSDFALPPMSVARALDVIGNVTGVRWKLENGVIKLVTPENAGGRRYLVQYEVSDVVQGVQSRPGVELKLSAPGDEDAGYEELEEDLVPSVVDSGKLIELINTNIAPDTWDDGLGASVTEQRGVLLVRHTREVHEKIEKLLADLRQAAGIQVDVETRFLQVEDSFLEDIGVDFRGLGDQSAEGLAGRGLENNGRSNAGFDDFGDRSFINPATPGQIGTGTEPGIFFDDGQDGDLMARTENLFDNTLGGGNLDNAGGLSLQYAYLDDTELEIVLRAVEKQERSEIVTAPRLLIYNNTRASMSVLTHTSYIRDFDVEIAQAAAVANPIIDVVRSGVVLDVHPVVSADRRFITMELRPTLMTLERPIPTFTTTLGVGQPVSIQLPAVTLQRVRTTVTMPDGGTLMLGGMKLTQKQYEVSGVPFLKDLPVLSFLFSRKGTFTLNRKILILIRARIVIPEEHMPAVTPDELSATMLGR